MITEGLVVAVFFLVGLFYFVYWFLTKDYNYWKDKNVPFLEPVFLFGSVKNEMLNKDSWYAFIDKCYVSFKNHGFGGMFFIKRPSVWFCDPKLIDKVLVEDFSYFHDRWSKAEGDSPQGNTLLFSKGEDWRTLRLKLATAFSSGRVKGMFHQILASAENLLQITTITDLHEAVDIETLAIDFSTESLASCLCGVQISSSKEATDFKRALNLIFKPSMRNNITAVLYMIFPSKLLKCCRIKRSPQKAIDTLTNVIKSILDLRKQSRTKRNDVLQTMLDFKEQEENQDLLEEVDGSCSSKVTFLKNFLLGTNQKTIFFNEETIATQILGFMSGGIKPVAVTITFALFETAKSSHIQNKVQKDIDSAIVKHKGWNLEALGEMTYLDQVIQETLRLYSFNPLLMRSVRRKYKIPGTDVTLDENMQVFIPVIGLHKDPDLYPNPLEFLPERWEGNNYRTSSTFLPFGHGPRICISIRLAVLTIKLCLARVLSQRHVSISPRMKLPLQFEDKEFYCKVKGGVWLEFKER